MREVAQHPNIEKIYMIEIDQEVINVAKKYFKNCASAYDDKRLELIIDDGALWVKIESSKLKKLF